MNLKLTRLAAVVLGSERGRKSIGWLFAAAMAPLILLVAFLCSLGAGEAEHNNNMIEACFYGVTLSGNTPDDLQNHIADMRTAFARLDNAAASASMQMEGGNSLDQVRIKAVFLALCFGERAPAARAAERFVDCFCSQENDTRIVETEEENGEITQTEEAYSRLIPLPLSAAYANISALLGREITPEDYDNISHIYGMIMGDMGNWTYDGQYFAPGGYNTALELTGIAADPTKTAEGLAAYAIHPYESGWGYVWGTFGNLLTEDALISKIEQYPEGVGSVEGFIRANWLGRRTTDCVGLIKSYGWYEPETDTIEYGSHGMPDYSANQMYYVAAESGPISTIPDIPGIAVWHDGHIGVYIGNGEVIEAMGTYYGVVKTKLAGRGWSHWLKIPYINYN